MTTILSSIEMRLIAARNHITQACLLAHRDPTTVRLIAASKSVDTQTLRTAIALGQRDFGENYVQEALIKIAELAQETRTNALRWHCIGPIQSNKTLEVAKHFDWVHTVDRLKIAQRLSAQRPSHLPDLQVCIQVNTDGGVNKSGVAPTDLEALARSIVGLPKIQLRGLMAIPESYDDPVTTQAIHLRLADLLKQLNSNGFHLDTLSMGMSADLVPAIAAGATMVRLGTAIFGQRSASKHLSKVML